MFHRFGRCSQHYREKHPLPLLPHSTPPPPPPPPPPPTSFPFMELLSRSLTSRGNKDVKQTSLPIYSPSCPRTVDFVLHHSGRRSQCHYRHPPPPPSLPVISIADPSSERRTSSKLVYLFTLPAVHELPSVCVIILATAIHSTGISLCFLEKSFCRSLTSQRK